MIGLRRQKRSRRASADDGGIRNAADRSAPELAAEVNATRASLPRLSLRFAIYTAVGLSFAAAVIVFLVRSYTMDEAEASVKRHSRVVAGATLAEELRVRDFTEPVSTKRRAQLDRIFRDRVLSDGIVEAVFLSPDGRVTYATNASRIGRRSQDAPEVRGVFGSAGLESRLDTRSSNGRTQKVMKVFVPARFDGGPARGVLVLSHEWEPILKSARKTYIVIAGVLELVLLALYLAFFPALRRVTKHLRQQLDEMERHALHDMVTGLPSRLLFRDRAEQALLRAQRSGEDVAVMLIHLDRFKHITDTLGEETGERLLCELAERLPPALRASDTFARLGGAEFGVVAPGAPAADLTMLAERIASVIGRPYFLDALELDAGATMGVALYPRDADDVSTLVLRADIARDNAKESNSRYAFYDPNRDTSDAARLTLVSRLRAAIEANELTLDFQPTFDLRSGAIVSAEALVRWPHPDRGPLEPADFLGKAAEARQTPALTRWVLESALRECSAWRARGWRLPVAVNVDMRSLLDESFVDEIELALNRNGIEPELLEVEISEESLMTEPERVAAVANRLSEYGVKLTLDDFGSGLASLPHLQGLPIHALKIDRSYVARLGADPTVKPIVGSILSLGSGLGLRVIAEGIETPAVLRAVAGAKCGFGQGFFLAEPLPSDEFMLVLEYTKQHETAAAATA
jgi:diguanylate cyclase (GGDEF)-like protein